MRTLLLNDICMERPNSAALGAFNASLKKAVNSKPKNVSNMTESEKKIHLGKILDRMKSSGYSITEINVPGYTIN